MCRCYQTTWFPKAVNALSQVIHDCQGCFGLPAFGRMGLGDRRHSCRPEGVQVGYGQVLKAVELDEFVEPGHRLPGDREFAEAVLRGDSPRARRAGHNDVSLVANQLPGMGRELRIIRPPPEQGVGVQQISHRASHA